MIGVECGKCIYFESGLCHRYPPIVSVVIDSKDELVPTLSFPTVEEDDWCGEFISDVKN